MKAKAILAVALIAFAAASVAVLVLKERASGGGLLAATPSPGVANPLPSSVSDTNQPARKLVVYYFHGNARCPSCLRIESYTREAVQKHFAAELATGRLEWHVVNVEEPENRHFVADYQLYTKSVVLSDVQNGKQVRWRNAEKVWELLHSKEAFLNYIRDEVNTFLNGSGDG